MKKPRKRVTEEEYQVRLEQLLGLKADGYSKSQLIKVAREQYGICLRHARRYVEEVIQAEKALAKGEPIHHFALLLNRTRRIHHKAAKEKDLVGEVRATELEMKLLEKMAKQPPAGMLPFYDP